MATVYWMSRPCWRAKRPGYRSIYNKHNGRLRRTGLLCGSCLFLGDRLLLTLTRGGKGSVIQRDEEIHICLSNRISADRVADHALMLLRSWYQQQAYSWFSQRVDYWQNIMRLDAEMVVIGNWKTKWGYCKSGAELGFNWRLLMAPSWVADYVVVHELAHLKHMNHSAQFWQLVEQYFPQRRHAVDWLKQNQHWMTL